MGFSYFETFFCRFADLPYEERGKRRLSFTTDAETDLQSILDVWKKRKPLQTVRACFSDFFAFFSFPKIHFRAQYLLLLYVYVL